MFSLGEKLRVLNTNADVAVYDGTNAVYNPVGQTAAQILAVSAAGGYFTVSGFGKFLMANLTDFRASRGAAAVAEIADFAVVAPTGVAVGNVIEARITTKTERYQGELATNYIGGGRPVVIQTAPLIGTTNADIAAAIVAAWTSYKTVFAKSTPVFNLAVNGGTNVRSTVAAGYESISVVKIEISISAQGAGSYPKTSLARTVITAGTQGRGLGKFLEESIRVSTAENTRAYGLTDAIDTQVDLRGTYTQFNWDLQANYDEVLGNDSSDLKPLANHKFSLWLNETNCLSATTGAITKLASLVAGLGVPALPGATIAAPSLAQFSAAPLIYKDDSSIGGATVAAAVTAFIA